MEMFLSYGSGNASGHMTIETSVVTWHFDLVSGNVT